MPPARLIYLLYRLGKLGTLVLDRHVMTSCERRLPPFRACFDLVQELGAHLLCPQTTEANTLMR